MRESSARTGRPVRRARCAAWTALSLAAPTFVVVALLGAGAASGVARSPASEGDAERRAARCAAPSTRAAAPACRAPRS